MGLEEMALLVIGVVIVLLAPMGFVSVLVSNRRELERLSRAQGVCITTPFAVALLTPIVGILTAVLLAGKMPAADEWIAPALRFQVLASLLSLWPAFLLAAVLLSVAVKQPRVLYRVMAGGVLGMVGVFLPFSYVYAHWKCVVGGVSSTEAVGFVLYPFVVCPAAMLAGVGMSLLAGKLIRLIRRQEHREEAKEA